MHVLSTPPAFILSQDQTLMFKSFDTSTSLELAKYPLQFYLLFIKDLFSEYSSNGSFWTMNLKVRFLNRIFRVALLFICQCSVFIFCFTLPGTTLIEYHKLSFPVKHFFKLFYFHIFKNKKVLCRFFGFPQRRNLSYHAFFKMSTGNCIFFHIFF